MLNVDDPNMTLKYSQTQKSPAAQDEPWNRFQTRFQAIILNKGGQFTLRKDPTPSKIALCKVTTLLAPFHAYRKGP
jgi:hypothetical protein